MKSQLPLHCLKPKILQEIPRALYMPPLGSGDFTSPQKRQNFFKRLRKSHSRDPGAGSEFPFTVSLNVAAWIRLPKAAPHTLSLVLVKSDAGKKTGYLVDEGLSDPISSLMLSGEVQVTMHNPPEWLSVGVIGLPPDLKLLLDELYVQPSGDSFSKTSAPHPARRA